MSEGCFITTEQDLFPISCMSAHCKYSRYTISSAVCGLFANSGFPAPSYIWKTAVLSSQVSGQRGAEIKWLHLFFAAGFSRSLWKEDVIQWALIIGWINLISLNEHGGEQSS